MRIRLKARVCKHDWENIEIEHIRCRICHREQFGMFVDIQLIKTIIKEEKKANETNG